MYDSLFVERDRQRRSAPHGCIDIVQPQFDQCAHRVGRLEVCKAAAMRFSTPSYFKTVSKCAWFAQVFNPLEVILTWA